MPARDSYKRAYDLAALLLAHMLLAPLLLLLWVAIPLAIRICDGRPVFYTQERLGRHGKPFRIYKFRTMPIAAERATGPVWAHEYDPRATRLGMLLRVSRLDEMPQAFNILRGEMSLVGPRPERPELTLVFERTIPGWRQRLSVRPGIAGLAQISRYGHRPRHRLRYDILYIRRMNPALDTRLLLACVLVVLRRVWQLRHIGNSSEGGRDRVNVG